MVQSISQDLITQIQQEVNIVDIVSQYVQLKKRGKNYFGYCPFHTERTPSFSVTEEKQIFHCFSCGRGGTVFNFISEIEGISFPESVAKVNDLAGLTHQIKVNKTEVDIPKKHNLLYEAHKVAGNLYQHMLLNTRGGEDAYEYLLNRGYTRETIEQFGLGYSPKNRTVLYQQITALNLSQQELEETGLFVNNSEQNDWLDRFSERLIIPLRDTNGSIIGFSGRLLHEDKENPSAKYLNSPETPLFNKRKFLFNFDVARAEIRKESMAVLFEGYMDVIAAYQAGIKYGVASMGTSLTQEQIQLLNRVTDHIVIAYDGDRAGLEATNRAIELLQQHSQATIRIFPLEDGIDPDEYIKKYGAEQFNERLLHHNETVFEFKKRFLKQSYRLEIPKEKAEYIEKVVEELVKTSHSPIELEVMKQDLSREIGISIEVLNKAIEAQPIKQHTYTNNSLDTQEQFSISYQNNTYTPTERWQQQLLYRLFHYPESWGYLQESDAQFVFPTVTYQQVYMLLQHYRQINDLSIVVLDFLSELTDEESIQLVSSLEWLELSQECTAQEIEDLVYRLSTETVLKETYETLKQQLAQTTENSSSILNQMIAIQKKLKQRIKV